MQVMQISINDSDINASMSSSLSLSNGHTTTSTLSKQDTVSSKNPTEVKNNLFGKK